MARASFDLILQSIARVETPEKSLTPHLGIATIFNILDNAKTSAPPRKRRKLDTDAAQSPHHIENEDICVVDFTLRLVR